MQAESLHKYLFKEGCKSAFQRMIDCNEPPLNQVDYGLLEVSDQQEYRTYLILAGVDSLSEERRQAFEQALTYLLVKQVF